MYNALYLISLHNAAEREQWCATLKQHLSAEAGKILVNPTLEGVHNGGDIIIRLRLADEAAWQAIDGALMAVLDDPAISHIDSATFGEGGGRENAPALIDGVYRGLLLSVDRPVKANVVAAFEKEMLAMPDYITTIRNARLAPVHHARGRLRWSHVWEQEYENIAGLMGPYMMHPYHWGHVDRWFDPECSDWMINTHICHSFCALDKALIHQK